MNKAELEGKLWLLCDMQDTMTDRNIGMGRPAVGRAREQLLEEFNRARDKRQGLIEEILDEFLRIHTVVNWPAEEALAEKRAWAAAWKRAAKKERAQVNGWIQMFRQRYELILEARAECTELANELGDLWALYMVILESAIGLGESARLCQSVLLKGKLERDEPAGSPVYPLRTGGPSRTATLRGRRRSAGREG